MWDETKYLTSQVHQSLWELSMIRKLENISKKYGVQYIQYECQYNRYLTIVFFTDVEHRSVFWRDEIQWVNMKHKNQERSTINHSEFSILDDGFRLFPCLSLTRNLNVPSFRICILDYMFDWWSWFWKLILLCIFWNYMIFTWTKRVRTSINFNL